MLLFLFHGDLISLFLRLDLFVPDLTLIALTKQIHKWDLRTRSELLRLDLSPDDHAFHSRLLHFTLDPSGDFVVCCEPPLFFPS